MTLVFPDSSSVNAPTTAPLGSALALPTNSSAELLPTSSNPLSTISHDTSLAFSIPYSEASEFIAAIQELPAPEVASEPHENDGTREEKKWIMKAVKNVNSARGLRGWATDAWTSFVDLLKVGDTTLTATTLMLIYV